MEEYICFYNQKWVMTHCVITKAIDYDDAESKFKEYLKVCNVNSIEYDDFYINKMECIDII